MSSEDLVRLAEHHRFYAERALAAARRKTDGTPALKSVVSKPRVANPPVSPAVPTGEGSSKDRGKGVDPRNFGAVPSLIDFTEEDLAAQREALANFEEINRVIKQESVTPATGLFDDIPLLDLDDSPVPSEEPLNVTVPTEVGSTPFINASAHPPRNKGGKKSGQTKEQEIAELEKRLSELRQSEPLKRTERLLPSQAKRIVQENLLNATACRNTSSANAEAPTKLLTPARTRPGEFLEHAIRDTARNGGGTPPSDSSDSSSSSDTEPGSSGDDGDVPIRRKKSAKSKKRTPHKMLLKPIPPTKYDGCADATLFYRLCRASTSFVRVGRVPAWTSSSSCHIT
jgi:hypothetical protein